MDNNNQPFQGCCPLSPGSKPPKLPRLIGPPGPPGPQGIQGIQGIQGEQGPGVTPAFGSLYGDITIREIMFGGLIEFDPPAGPSLNTLPNPATNTIAIQMNGVYEISADITVLLESGESVGFWIEGSSTGMIVGSRFDTFISSIEGDIVMENTIGRTVQTNLIAGETVFIRAVSEAGSARYRSASLTVNRIGP